VRCQSPLRYRWSASVSRIAWGQLFAIVLLFIVILYIISLYLAMYICTCHVRRLPAHAGTRAHKPGMQLARAPALCRTRPHITRFAVCGREQALHPLHMPQYTIYNIQYVALVCVCGLSIIYFLYMFIDLSHSNSIMFNLPIYTYSTVHGTALSTVATFATTTTSRQSVKFYLQVVTLSSYVCPCSTPPIAQRPVAVRGAQASWWSLVVG
jgi:hypothetical protein